MSLSAKEISLYHGAKCYVEAAEKRPRPRRSDGQMIILDEIIEIDGNVIQLVEQGKLEVKPILRPLSPKERQEAMYSMDSPNNVVKKIREYKDVFGWIDQDKAINALELEPNPYRDE